MNKIKEFFVGAFEELGKVTWPIKKGKHFTFYERYQELVEATMVVIIASLIFAVVIYAYDLLIAHLISSVIA